MGIGYSLVPAAIWPSVVLVVENENLHGTAYGLTTAAYNIGTVLGMSCRRVPGCRTTAMLEQSITQ